MEEVIIAVCRIGIIATHIAVYVAGVREAAIFVGLVATLWSFEEMIGLRHQYKDLRNRRHEKAASPKKGIEDGSV
jgi:hypothetical protein